MQLETITMWLLEISIFCCALLVQVSADDVVVVDVTQGSLKGYKTMTVTTSKPYYGFKGVPFAKPMIGESKFDVSYCDLQWTFSYNVIMSADA